MKLQGKIALVTGANRGIGRAAAEGLAREGALVLVGHRKKGDADSTLAAIVPAGFRAEALQIDVEDPASIERAAKDVAARHGKLHILVNNAGVLEDDGQSTETLPIEMFERTMRVNVRGPLLCCQRFLPLLRKAGWGRIVNVTSGLGRLGEGMSGGYPAYRMSKTALNALTANLASEVHDDAILVNAVDPGWVRTDMGGENAPWSPKEGADTVVWACMLPDDGPTGKVLHERAVSEF